MQTKVIEKRLARKLRRKGYSYREIRKHIPVAKSSLSLWLRDISLTQDQRRRLEKLNTDGQKLGAAARRQQRLDRLSRLRRTVSVELLDLISDEFFMFGLALYWAEGTKQKPWNLAQSVVFGNSDPRSVLIMRRWFEKFCDVTPDRFGYRLHIHKTADVAVAKKWWSQLLSIRESELKVSLKLNDSKFRHNKLVAYKGLIHLKVYKSTWLNRRIELWAEGAAKHFLRD